MHDWSRRSGRRPSPFERIVELVIRWLVLALAVWAAAEVVKGIHLEGWKSTLAVALILGFLNLYLRPLLVKLSLPMTVLTLGLFLVVINAGLLDLASWLAGKIGNIRFHVDDFGAALLGALVISVVSFLAGMFISPRNIARDLTG